MPKSAPDFLGVSARHMHAGSAHVNNKSIWKIGRGRRRKHAARAKKWPGHSLEEGEKDLCLTLANYKVTLKTMRFQMD